MSRYAWLPLLLLVIAMCGCEKRQVPLREQYPGPWREAFNIGITKALIKNHVGGCGQYKYRESAEYEDEYLVYCTADGTVWKSYLVWPNTGGVVGPSAPDPSLQ